MRRSLLLSFSVVTLALVGCNDDRLRPLFCVDPPCGDVREDAGEPEADAAGDLGVGVDATALDVVVREDASLCVPDCNSTECGDDGCGGSCGTCEAGDVCLGGFCTPEAVEPTPPARPGPETCAELVYCPQDCRDQDCVDACFEQAPEEALFLYESLATCIDIECSALADDAEAFDACQFDACGDAWGDCFGLEGPIGEAGCDEAIDCVAECDTEVCLYGCFLLATEPVTELLAEVFECAAEVCPDDPSVVSTETYIDCAVLQCFEQVEERCP